MGRRSHRQLRVGEFLEARTVLASHVLITEWGAHGSVSIDDEDGARSDWIELYNDGESPVDLSGWHLTDEAERPTKWTLPAGLSLGAREYLVVYASGKDRADASSQLHTNFRLSESGEYLALVQPDGRSIASAYEGHTLTMLPGATYGRLQAETVTPLFESGDPFRYWIPSPDGATTASRRWIRHSFDDSTWNVGAGGLGFDTSGELISEIDLDTASQMLDKAASIDVRIPFGLDGLQPSERIKLKLRYDDGFAAYLNGADAVARNAPLRATTHSVATWQREMDGAPTAEEAYYFGPTDFNWVAGENLLAVRGLNFAADDSDFFLDVAIDLASPGDLIGEQTGWFATPTPGRANGTEVVEGKLSNVEVSLPHGIYQSPQTVTLTAPQLGATLVYTTDGSRPTPTHGTTVTNTEELATTQLELSQVTTLRVGAFQDGWLPSEVETVTYLFLDDVIQQSPDGDPPAGWPANSEHPQLMDYGMDPVVVNDPEEGPLLSQALTQISSISIVTNSLDLFDPERGIFVNGVASRTNESLWQRPTSVELIHPDGREGFQIDAGLRLRGGYGRDPNNPKHAFRLFFSSQYGDANLEYPLFGPDGADRFDKLDLRTASAPSWSFCAIPETQSVCDQHTLLREVFPRDTLAAMGQPTTRSQYYHLYLNGQYWGIYMSEERPDQEHAETYLGGQAENYDVVKVESFPHRVVTTHGNMDAWQMLWQAAVDGFESDAAYQKVLGRDAGGQRDPELPVLLNVDNLIDYMLTIFYTGDLDAPISNFGNNTISNNWFGVRDREGDEGFHFFAHDGEWGLMDVNENRLGPWPAGDTLEQSNPQWIHQRLMENADYRLRFIDRAYQHLSEGGALSPEEALRRFDQRVKQIDLAIIAESARWGDTWRQTPLRKADWLDEIEHIREVFIPQRTEILIEQLRGATLYPRGEMHAPLYAQIDPPQFLHPEGPVDVGTQVSIASDAAVYYTLDGTDPRRSERTVLWSPLVGGEHSLRYLVPTDERFDGLWIDPDFDDSSWTVSANGVGYGPSVANWVQHDIRDELRGVSGTVYARYEFSVDDPADLSALRLRMRYDDGFVAYLNGIPVASEAAPETLGWDATATIRTTGEKDVVFGLDAFLPLVQPGKNVLAVQGLNTRVSDIDFLLWAEIERGTIVDQGLSASAQPYVTPITVSQDTVVTARAYQNGEWSPRVDAVFYTADTPLRISEIMYHPAPPDARERAQGFTDANDFEYVELLNISSEEAVNLLGYELVDGIDFVFPSFVLQPGQRAVVVRNEQAFRTRYGDRVRVVGQYGLPDGSNRLSNGGETVELRNDERRWSHAFQYADWYSATDGRGRSLQVQDPFSVDLRRWSQPAGWRPSRRTLGSPGIPDRIAGDSNGDGVFDSQDLVTVFQLGQFEDSSQDNSTFEGGDWDGDGDFTTSDLVLAFQQGNYTRAAQGHRHDIAAALDAIWATDAFSAR